MERLTEHHANKTLGAYMVCSGACIKEDFDCTLCENLNKIVNTLAAYEDTGLEPEDIDALQKRERGLAEMLVNVSCGCVVPYTRLAELARAEKDGRLVVLPCKVGDTVYEANKRGFVSIYEVISIHVSSCSILVGWNLVNGIYSNLNGFEISALGKTVFLTREEAEAALKKREED